MTIRFAEGEEEKTAEVWPGANSNVTFFGIVETMKATTGQIREIIVDLSVSLPYESWNATIYPSQLRIFPGHDGEFSVNITVPIESSSYIRAELK
ncbi:MAG: hypothetical protein JSV49_01665, partial [Thermoplasmata archaeon]